MRNYFKILFILFLCSEQNLRCQSTEHILKVFDCYTYVVDNEKVNVCEVMIKNTSNEDYVIWFEKQNTINLNEKEKIQLYFFKIKEDFNFYNLIVEKLLTNQQVIIFDTFLKTLKTNEIFTVKITGKSINKDKMEKFILEHMVLIKLSTLEKRLKLSTSYLPWFNRTSIDLIDTNLP